MNKLALHLENCYGIPRLNHEFDFSKGSAFALYAPNGTMKSSLAQTFHDLQTESESRDRMYPHRRTVRRILTDGAKELEASGVFVVKPYDEEFEAESASTLLVNSTLRREYEGLLTKISKAQDILLTALEEQAKTKIDVEAELNKVFADRGDTLLKRLQAIRAQLSVDHKFQAEFKDVEYDKFFDDKVIGPLQEEPIKGTIKEYIESYDALLSKSKYFKKGVFNYYGGSEVCKSLGSHGFFSAGHQLTLKADENTDITEAKALDNLIKKEKELIADDPELRTKFEKIDKALKKNVNLRAYEEYLCDHQELLPLLSDIPEAKALVWLSYLKEHFRLLHDLIEKYESAEKRRREIERQAEREKTRWEEVIDIFNSRFFVPFELSVSNKATASLGAVPVLQFSFDDGSEKVAVDRDDLLQALSQGEKKALYILNIIFEVQARLRARQETLFVVDDIADSFDYKNKYAIVQYLRDMADEPTCRLLLLTHNFDFFRTVQSRFVRYDHCLMVVRSPGELDLVPAVGIKNVFALDWKLRFHTDLKKRIASIPFIRNLIEYTRGEDDPFYGKLTSLLHWRADSTTIAQADLDAVFVNVFGGAGAWDERGSIVVDDIFKAADQCLGDPEGINFENKIVLSIAIRLAAERYMDALIADPAFVGAISGNQTDALIKKCVAAGYGSSGDMEVLRRVQLITPENIHLNAFMYEPILDMSDQHLRKLYVDVKNLGHAGEDATAAQ